MDWLWVIWGLCLSTERDPVQGKAGADVWETGRAKYAAGEKRCYDDTPLFFFFPVRRSRGVHSKRLQKLTESKRGRDNTLQAGRD